MKPKQWIPVLAAAGALGCGGAPGSAAAEPEKQVVRMTLQKRPLDEHDDLGFGTCQWLFPHDQPQEKLKAVPKFKSSRPVWYAAQFGDSPDNIFSLVIDESRGTGSGYDVLYVDSNNDNWIDAKKERQSFQLGTTSKAIPIYAEFAIATGGKTASHFFHFTAFPYSDDEHPKKEIHANLRNGSILTGKAVFGGERRAITLADLDSNGRFNDPEQALFKGDRFFVDLRQGGARRENLQSYPYGQYTQVAGRWYSVAASPDGSEIEISPASPPFGTVQAPSQIVRATLRSPRQTMALSFSNGQDRAIVGTYRVQSLTLREERASSSGKARELMGMFPERGPEVTIREGETIQLAAGPPLRIEVRPTRAAAGRTVGLNLVLVGSGGEIYRWNREANRNAARPGFEIHDAAGKTVLAASFEYG